MWQLGLTTEKVGGLSGKVFFNYLFHKITIFSECCNPKSWKQHQTIERRRFPSIWTQIESHTHSHTKEQPNTGIGCFVCNVVVVVVMLLLVKFVRFRYIFFFVKLVSIGSLKHKILTSDLFYYYYFPSLSLFLSFSFSNLQIDRCGAFMY